MVTVDTSEVTEEKLLFSEFLLWTRIDPWFRCSICIQLKSYNHSKRGGVSTPSHKEETEIQRSFSSLAEFHSCRMIKEDLTPGLSGFQAHHIPLGPRSSLGTCRGDRRLLGARLCSCLSISLSLWWVKRTEQQLPSKKHVIAVAVFRLQMPKSYWGMKLISSLICLKSSLLFMCVLLKQVLVCVQIFLIYIDDTVL